MLSTEVCSRKILGCCAEGGLGSTVLGQTNDIIPRPPWSVPQSPPSSQGVAKGVVNVKSQWWARGLIHGLRPRAPGLGCGRHHSSFAALRFSPSKCSRQTQNS